MAATSEQLGPDDRTLAVSVSLSSLMVTMAARLQLCTELASSCKCLDGADLSASEHIRERGELSPHVAPFRMVGAREAHDDIDDIDDDRDRDEAHVVVVESEDTDPGEDIKGVVDLIGNSLSVSAERMRLVMDGRWIV